MRFVLFCHSLLSDWNHGNAHFLRGVVTDLQARGHNVVVYEPREAWSLQNLLAEPRAEETLRLLAETYPTIHPIRYEPGTLNLTCALEAADAVLVHEWNDHELVQRLGRHRARHDHYRLLFHDTHHRSVTEREAMSAYDLEHYDGTLAFGQVIRDLYLREGWTRRAWTWHEAADARVFRPIAAEKDRGPRVDRQLGGRGAVRGVADVFVGTGEAAGVAGDDPWRALPGGGVGGAAGGGRAVRRVAAELRGA